MAVTVKVMVAPAGRGAERLAVRVWRVREHYADASRGRREVDTVGREVDGPGEGPASCRGEPHDRALGRAGPQGEGTAGDDAVGVAAAAPVSVLPPVFCTVKVRSVKLPTLAVPKSWELGSWTSRG